MEDIVIRPFQAADEADITALWEEVFPNPSPWNIATDDIRRKQAVQPELFFVAVQNEKIIGTAMGGYDGHRGWVYYLGVHPEFRRSGVGSRLMQSVEEALIAIGCSKLNLQVRASNVDVVNFYQQLGYSTEERVSMGKRLA